LSANIASLSDQPTGPDPDHFGLWLDKRRADCPADPFANAEKYPGVAIGARGKNLPAAGGREAGTKAVAALAHQFAGLISPFHGSLR